PPRAPRACSRLAHRAASALPAARLRAPCPPRACNRLAHRAASALHTAELRAPCPPHLCNRLAHRRAASPSHTRRTACPPARRTVATCVAAPSAPASPTTDTGKARSGLFRADDVVPLADGRQGRQLEGHAPGVVLTDAAHPILPLRRIVSA